MAMALAEPTDASQLLVPAIGVPDAGMNGATVGRPRIPSAAAFSNTAAVTSLKSGAASLSLGLPVGRSNVTATTPAGVRNSPDSQAAVFPGRYAIGGEIYRIGIRTNLGS